MRPGWFLVLLLAAPAAGAQSPAPAPMVKCADARGNITYSNVPCDKQGLKEVGQVADRTTVMPLGPAPKPPAPAGIKPPAGASKDDVEKAGAAAVIKPVVPQLEQLLKK